MPKKYRVIVTPEAREDLDRITRYIKQDSPEHASDVFNRLWQAGQSLSHLPYRYSVRHHRRDPTKTVRAVPVLPFILYYRVAEKPSVARVLAVQHGRQKQPRRFK